MWYFSFPNIIWLKRLSFPHCLFLAPFLILFPPSLCLFVCLRRSVLIPLLSLYPKETKSGTWKAICAPLSFVAVFTTTKQRKRPDACRQVYGYRKCGVGYAVEYHSSFEQEGILPFVTTKDHALEGVMLIDTIPSQGQSAPSYLYVESRIVELIGAQNRWAVARIGGCRKWGDVGQRDKFQLCMWVSSGDLRPALWWVWLTSLHCILEIHKEGKL